MPGLLKVELVPPLGLKGKAECMCVLPSLGEIVVWRGLPVRLLVASHSQATFSSCLLVFLCVPHFLDPARGWGQRAFLCPSHHQHPGSESRGDGERVTLGRQMKDGWDTGTFLLFGWFLWSDICGGVRWWWGLCSGVRESGTESHLLHLLTEWFSALLSSPSPYFLIV